MSAEQWRPIAGFEGRYEVSDHGRVASLPTRTWPTRRIIAVVAAKRGGYPTVVLHLDNRQFCRKIHRLVCEAFNGAAPSTQGDAHTAHSTSPPKGIGMDALTARGDDADASY